MHVTTVLFVLVGPPLGHVLFETCRFFTHLPISFVSSPPMMSRWNLGSFHPLPAQKLHRHWGEELAGLGNVSLACCPCRPALLFSLPSSSVTEERGEMDVRLLSEQTCGLRPRRYEGGRCLPQIALEHVVSGT